MSFIQADRLAVPGRSAKNSWAAWIMAQWCHVEGGKVNRVQVMFDPRDILAGGPS